MTLNPTLYLYRFPGPHGPGPYTMKYWWTLGCFPTGREVPFRLQEFLTTYQQEHVPVEVEEWLAFYVKDPYGELLRASRELLDALVAYPEIEKTRGYRTLMPTVVPVLQPLKKFQQQLGIKMSPAGIRFVLSDHVLRERFVDDLMEYQSAIQRGGSTPHRRSAKRAIEDSSQPVGDSYMKISDGYNVEIGQRLEDIVNCVALPSETTADDEKKIIQLITTVSEGCIKAKLYSDASEMLGGALVFCHDTDSRAVTHANLAFASLLNGDFKSAEYNGREAALLQPQIEFARNAAVRGYMGWATAVALQDDFEKASFIVKDALSMFKGHKDLEILSGKIQQLRDIQTSFSENGEVPYLLRGSKSSLPSQQARALVSGSGRGFDNEFDWVTFKNKLYPCKMNPQNNEMGSVFRRVGDLGSFISTSRPVERL
ncbi:hypothetical protein ERJ75_000139400 [Trypanosoma vivax]|nr:hypothetical protein TRVL_06753 [Trypanosoma vivax]KAH8619660.1 hypothetical protein ERJ75_000139400 [Trypanosoma vivax]